MNKKNICIEKFIRKEGISKIGFSTSEILTRVGNKSVNGDAPPVDSLFVVFFSVCSDFSSRLTYAGWVSRYM